MHKDDNVYMYVINSVNNILTNGINYYSDKNDLFKERLLDLYNYVNQERITYSSEDVIKDSINKECRNNFRNTLNNSDVLSRNILTLIDSFLNKLVDIKISILNLEDDLSLYYDDLSKHGINNKLIDMELFSEFNSNDKLKLDDDSLLLLDNNETTDDIALENDDLVDNWESFRINTKIEDSNSNNEEIEEESLEDEEISRLTQDKVDNKSDDLNKKHSILDLFRKKDR